LKITRSPSSTNVYGIAIRGWWASVVSTICRVHDIQFRDHLPLVVAEEGEGGVQLLTGRPRGGGIVRPHNRELTVIDSQLRLQVRHVVRQLANILRSVISS